MGRVGTIELGAVGVAATLFVACVSDLPRHGRRHPGHGFQAYGAGDRKYA